MTMTSFIGHEAIRERLISALQYGVTPEAYLFYGRSGVGKTTLAKAFAQALVLGNKQLTTFFKEHIDIHIIELDEEAHTHSIQTIRSIKDLVYLPPMCGQKKVIIIKQAHKMQPAASHALLKCLEEPSSSTIFILLAPSVLDVLPTIASRCCKVAFHPLKEKELVEFLQHEKNITPEKASLLAKASMGDLNELLLSLTEREEKWKKAAFDIFVRFPFLPYKEFSEALAIIEESLEGKKGRFLDRFLDYTALLLKDLSAVKRGQEKQVLSFPIYFEDYQHSSSYLKPSLEGIMKCLESFYEGLSLHVKIKVALEAFVFRLYR